MGYAPIQCETLTVQTCQGAPFWQPITEPLFLSWAWSDACDDYSGRTELISLSFRSGLYKILSKLQTRHSLLQELEEPNAVMQFLRACLRLKA